MKPRNACDLKPPLYPASQSAKPPKGLRQQYSLCVYEATAIASIRDRSEASNMEPEAAVDHQNQIDSPPNRITSPLAAFHHRPGYQRISSVQEQDTSFQDSRPVGVSELPEDDSVHGLRIKFSDHDEEALAFGASANGSANSQPGSRDYLLSPLSARSSKHRRHASLGGTSPYVVDDTSSYGRSSQSSMSRLEKPFTADPEDEQLFAKGTRSSTQSFDTSGTLMSSIPKHPN